MAVLSEKGGTRRITLGASTLIGRSSRCTVVLASAEVSGQHAVIFWGPEGWVVRDLGSRNGTRVDGRAVPDRERVALPEGAVVEFADEPWVVESVHPPLAAAVDPAGRRAEAVDGLLALPSPMDPVITIFASRIGRWIAERDGAPQFVTDGDAVSVGAETWSLELPPLDAQRGTATTAASSETPHAIASVRTARFAVSGDEETIELTLIFRRGSLDVPQRVHHGLLRVLAQARLDDRDLSPAEQGWMYTDDACVAAGLQPERLPVEVYRARKQLAAMGLSDAADVIERRSSTRQLRLGIAQVEVVPL